MYQGSHLTFVRRFIRFIEQPGHWVSRVAAGFLFGAVLLRSIITYRSGTELAMVLGVLFIWALLASSEPFISQKIRWYFPTYLVVQTVLVFVLLLTPSFSDFFATLLLVLSIQVFLRLNVKAGLLWIGLCAVIIGLILFPKYGSQAIALSLLYTSGNILLGFFALTMLRAQDGRVRIENLALQLQQANDKLESYLSQMKELGASRERNRLARDLHDSVTQTVFSMSLTAQSAKLLLDRDPCRLKEQLQRMEQLSQSALSEMKLLVTEMQPSEGIEGGLVSALRKHLASRRFPENFSILLQPEGNRSLSPVEEQGLFRIVLEALNNILKHAQTSEATIRLYLEDPFWIEIEDHGKGFNVQKALINGVGLRSMSERAEEIGWELQITSSLGEGTRVRALKTHPKGDKNE